MQIYLQLQATVYISQRWFVLAYTEKVLKFLKVKLLAEGINHIKMHSTCVDYVVKSAPSPEH